MAILRIIRGLPLWLEILLVVLVAFGPHIYAAVGTIWDGTAGTAKSAVWTNRTIVEDVAIDITVGLFVAAFLWLRGWRPADIHMRLTWRGTWHGILTFIATMALLTAVGQIQEMVFPGGKGEQPSVTLSPGAVLLASLGAGVYEEIFVCGYLITALMRLTSERNAVFASVLLRMSYHVYQGAGAVLSHLSIGWFFAWVYLRRGDLWPLILAHTLWDIMAFGLSTLGH